jgi:hypothetical protein
LYCTTWNSETEPVTDKGIIEAVKDKVEGFLDNIKEMDKV